MKRILRPLPLLALVAFGLVAHDATAQRGQKSQDELKQLFADKIKEGWFVDGGWTHDFAAAKERAKKENKVVFAYFSRSYSP